MTCGIIDLGSNTIRLSLYDWQDGSYQLLLNKKEMTGLAGYSKGGVLSPEGIEAAARVLTDYRRLLSNLNISSFRAFATASLRNISNTDEALEALRDHTGIEIEVLTGAEEARLSFLGARSAAAGERGLLADIGGGSTELVAYEGCAVTCSHSLPLGSLNLYTGFVSGLFPTRDESRAIRACVKAALAKMGLAPFQGPYLCGVGGTIRAAGKLLFPEAGEDGSRFTARDLKQLRRDLRKGDKGALDRILRCVPDRIHTLLPGLLLLDTIVKICGVETIQVSGRGVREGYLMDRIMTGGSHA